ncbi:hypothetical protein L596_003549 [Steinernema carpocapsae]|nr:hypothetical protein L596_003549 [Steinernema carpocapsae]
MVIEGGYLYSRFTVYAMRSCEPPFWMFLLGGWGAPFCIVMVWTIIHQYQTKFVANSFCWLPYAKGIDMWILAGTMGAAILVNCLFLLGIVAILVQKFRSENTAESKKIWRTIKATLLLVPLLGVSNIPLFYEPDHPSGAYMLISAILQHSQGIFVAVLYCFLNSEIQNAVRRKLGNWRCRWLQNRDFETQRTYVPETGIVNKRHGIPMEQLEGVSDSHSQKSTKGEASTN